MAILAAGLALLLWPRPRLNVILVTLDTVRADHVGCYGYGRAQTPAFDALAEEGVLFQKVYAPAPLTLPAHASMLTGCYPPVHGLHLNGRGRLASSIPVLSELLSQQNYHTGAFLASYVLNAKFGLKRGFQRYDDEPSWTEVDNPSRFPRRDGASVMAAALQWIERRGVHPFFCWIHLYDAHADPESRHDPHRATFAEKFVEIPYDGGVAYADLQIERLRQLLRSTKLDERTLLIVVGDHGEGLMEHAEREHGYLLYDSTLRVPMVFAGPKFLKRRHVVPQHVSLVDLMPTILDCLGLPQRFPTCGQSLRPALTGGVMESRPCFAATDAPLEYSGWAPLRSVVTERWKYIETTRPELYDLTSDPQEQHDLAGVEPDQCRELVGLLHSLQSQMAARTVSAAKTELTSQERRKLESLGYAGVSSQPTQPGDGEPRPDVKDMIPLYNDLHEKVVAARDFVRQTRSAEAIPILKAVLDKVPGYLDARLLLGEALLQQNEFSEAAKVLERLLADQPDRAETHALLGKTLLAQDQIPRAINHFRYALKFDPSVADVHFNFARALLRVGNRMEAIAELKETVRRDPSHLEAPAELERLSHDNDKSKD